MQAAEYSILQICWFVMGVDWAVCCSAMHIVPIGYKPKHLQHIHLVNVRFPLLTLQYYDCSFLDEYEV